MYLAMPAEVVVTYNVFKCDDKTFKFWTFLAVTEILLNWSKLAFTSLHLLWQT